MSERKVGEKMFCFEKTKLLSRHLKMLVEQVKNLKCDSSNEEMILSLCCRIKETSALIKNQWLSDSEIRKNFLLLIELIKLLENLAFLLDEQIKENDPPEFIKFINEAICLVIRSHMNIEYVVTVTSELNDLYREMRS